MWRFATGGEIKSSPAIFQETLYVGSHGGRLYALDAKTALERWRFRTLNHVFSSPIIADGVVYFGSDDGHLYAVE